MKGREKRALFFFLRARARVSSFSQRVLFCLFSFFFCRKRSASFFIIFTHTRTFFDVCDTEHITRRAREESSTRTHTHTQKGKTENSFSRSVSPRSFSSCFHSLCRREREREERFDFDRKDEASSRLWQPPSLRFEFCGSLSSIEKFLKHTFFSLTRAEEREKEEEERKSRACVLGPIAANFIFLLSFIFLQRSCACLVTFLLISSLSLSLSHKKTSLWKVDKIK